MHHFENCLIYFKFINYRTYCFGTFDTSLILYHFVLQTNSYCHNGSVSYWLQLVLPTYFYCYYYSTITKQ